MKQTSKFKIGLDFRMAAHTGIGTHLRGLVGGFKDNQTPQSSHLALFKPADMQVNGGGFSEILFDAPIYSLKEQMVYPNLIKTCELWHSPHYNIPYFKGHTKLLTTIHDIIHWKYRHSLSLAQRTYAKQMFSRASEISNHIIAVSEFTKQDLIENFSVNPEKITVIYNGVSEDFFSIIDEHLEKQARPVISKYKLPEHFLLYVGMLRPHKNIARLMRNYLQLRNQGKISIGLVVVGEGKKNSEELNLLGRASDHIHYLPKISFGELPIFYNLARALVHPSLYEGFGLTVAEAMACGTPVLTTKRSALPEVGGDVAFYVEGENDAEWQEALVKLDQDTQIKSRLRNDCIRQAAKFSWTDAASKTALLYDKVLNLC